MRKKIHKNLVGIAGTCHLTDDRTDILGIFYDVAETDFSGSSNGRTCTGKFRLYRRNIGAEL